MVKHGILCAVLCLLLPAVIVTAVVTEIVTAVQKKLGRYKPDPWEIHS